jgi:hypothetical protein
MQKPKITARCKRRRFFPGKTSLLRRPGWSVCSSEPTGTRLSPAAARLAMLTAIRQDIGVVSYWDLGDTKTGCEVPGEIWHSFDLAGG